VQIEGHERVSGDECRSDRLAIGRRRILTQSARGPQRRWTPPTPGVLCKECGRVRNETSWDFLLCKRVRNSVKRKRLIVEGGKSNGKAKLDGHGGVL